MTLPADMAFVGGLLDAYFRQYPARGVALEDPEDEGVPAEMQDGPIDDEGWVAWKMLPSTLTEDDLRSLEGQFGIQFPPLFRAYLLARSHLFDQVRSRRYEQLILLPATPSHHPLGPLRAELEAWRPLIDAGLIPFAEWGDGWGPMGFDVERRAGDGDCPIAWLDHEVLVSLGPEACRERAALEPHLRPLYDSSRELLIDVFT